MAQQQAVRRFGVLPGAAGIEVIERPGVGVLSDPRYGTSAMFGVAKRGPMNIPIPISSRREYDENYGDPRDPTWHLYPDGSHLMPDAIDGYYATGGGAGQLWITRIAIENARKAQVVLKTRTGADALRIVAANEGRWGGMKNALSRGAVIAATARTFTIVAPGVFSNEFADAEVEFSSAPGKRYKIITNTAASSSGGEVIFTIGAQYNLATDGVSGPVAIAGTARFDLRRPITGTVNFPLQTALTGTANINQATITGAGTAFNTELTVGQNIYYNDEARRVESITSATTLTIDSPFSTQANNVTLNKDNLTVTGTGTLFVTELAVGEVLSFTFGDEVQSRSVVKINSDTSLVLSSGFTRSITGGSLQRENREVVGTGTNFTADVQVGQYIVDPNRMGNAVRVQRINSATSLVVETPFSRAFNAAQLTRQSQWAKVDLVPPSGQGLAVEVGQGTRFPETHFSLTIRFNQSLVLQIADASLDPNDALYVEPLVNDSNIAYRTGTTNYQKWITAESLWSSAYTTSKGSDVRPCNGSGKTLAVATDRIYTVAELDYSVLIGNLLYPDPYKYARGYFRIKNTQAPLALEGTISSSGVNVTGTGTTFRSTLKAGDYLYDPVSATARKIATISSNTALVLESAFPANVPVQTKATRSGYLQVDRSYNLSDVAKINDVFLVVYPQFLEGGFDGDTGNLFPYHFTRYADSDINVLENATWGKNLGLIRIATPGISDITVQKSFAFYASSRAYEYRAEIPSTYSSAAAAESFVNQSLGRNDFQSIAFPSYGFIANPKGVGDRMVPLSGDVMGGESAQAVLSEGYHIAFAGVRAILSRVLKLPIEVSPSEEAILNLAGIQPIKTMNGNAVIFGARLPSLSSIFDFLHIRRIQSNYVRVFLEARTLLEMLFSPNQPGQSDMVVTLLQGFARREYAKGVYSQYLSFEEAVQVSSMSSLTGGTSEQAQDVVTSSVNGKLAISYRYIPAGILERLSIDCGPDILVANYGSALANQVSL